MNAILNLCSVVSATMRLLFAAGFIASTCLTQAQTNILAVVINEVLANNQSFTNADGTITDWVELCNLTAQPLELADCSLTDDRANPRRWIFPTGTTVPPSGFLIVRCDSGSPPSAGSGGVLNAGFSFNSKGGRIHLFDRLANGGAMLDSLVFGLQIPDFSVGRVPDGTGAWVLCRPTAAAPNVPASLGSITAIKLNEWMSHPQNDDSDWFELYNPLPQPVALGGSYLTDNLDNPTQYCIPPYSYLGFGGGGFVVFYADHNVVEGADHTGFRLGNGGGEIGLFSAAGNAVDTVTYGAQPEGISEGRLPDGGTTIVQFPGSATPGAPNRVLVVEPPSITQQPLSQTNIVGSTVSFSVTATGTPPLAYQWEKDGANLSGQTNASLTLTNVQLADAGQYRVVVSNAVGSVTSGEATLTVLPSQSLVVLGSLDTSGWAQGLTLSGNFAYLADGDAGLQVMDISNPANPQRVGGYDTSEYALAVVVSGNCAYVADGFSGVQAIDVSNPANPHRVGGYQTSNMFAETLAVSGNHLFVVGDEALHLRVLDISDPANPHQVGGCQIGGDADGITVSGHYAFLVDGDFGLRVVDISDPSNPRLVGSCQTDDDAEGVVVSGHYAYVTDEVGLKIIDISDPAHPTLVGACGIGDYADVALSGHYAYVASHDTGVQAIDISNPANARLVGGNSSFSASGIVASGGILYVAGSSDGLVILRGMPENCQAPTITSQPSSQTNIVGSTVTFYVTAAGTPPLTYQWQKEAANLSGETGYILTLANVQLADAGVYQVIVSNSAGIATSSEATLTVFRPEPGRVLGWGDGYQVPDKIPSGLSNVAGIAAAVSHGLALRDDGTVAAWGEDCCGALDVPPGLSNVVAIDGGTCFSVALKGDGTVVAWGANSQGETDVPPGLSNVVAIACGGAHTLALREDGSVVEWGYQRYGANAPPEGLSNVVAIACGGGQSLAIKEDGSVVG